MFRFNIRHLHDKTVNNGMYSMSPEGRLSRQPCKASVSRLVNLSPIMTKRRFKLSKQAIELLCLCISLLLVPTKSLAQIKSHQQHYQSSPQPQQHSYGLKQSATDPLWHLPTTLDQNTEWTRRLVKTGSQERQDSRSTSLTNSRPDRSSDPWALQLTSPQQAPNPIQQLRPLAHLVASQGQRLLRSLTNHSLDVTPYPFVNGRQAFNASFDPATAIMQQNQSVQTEYRPFSIGKLHNLLFPNDRPNNTIAVVPSELGQNFLSNDTSDGRPKATLINLNAPYESRPRLSISGVKRVARAQNRNKESPHGNKSVDSGSLLTNSWMDPNSPHNESGLLPKDQQKSLIASDSDFSLDEHKYRQLQNSSDLHLAEGIQDTQPEHSADKNELYWAANQQMGSVQSGESSPRYVTTDDSAAPNYGDESYPAEQKSEAADELNNGNEDPTQVMQVEPDQSAAEPESNSYLNNQIYTGEEDNQHKASDQQDMHSHHINGSMGNNVDQAGEQYLTDGEMTDSEQANAAGVELGSPFESDNQTYMTIQLPSQYDSAIRLPPEGYYDDYFKPESSNLMSPPPQNNLITSSHDFTQFSQPQTNEHHYELGIPQNASHRDYHNISDILNNNSTYPTPNVDYTNQYYLNQKPLQQVDSQADQNVDFLTPNRTSVGYGDHHSMQNSSQSVQNNDWNLNQLTNLTLGQQYLEHQGGDPEVQQKSNASDSFQLIIANTNNSSRDPVSNEKVINYISEGLNFTTRPGRPARNTFVNKEMNEGAPAPVDPPAYNPSTEQPMGSLEYTTMGSKHPVYNYETPRTTRGPSLNSERDSERGARRQQVARDPDHQLAVDQQQGEFMTSRYHGHQQPLRRPHNDEDSDLSRDIDSKKGDYGKYTGHRSNEQSASDVVRAQSSEDNNRLLPNDESEQDSGDDSGAIRRATYSSTGNHNRGTGKGSPVNRQHSHNNQNDRRNRHHGKMNDRGQVRRPQLTEARFEPKDLIMTAPTAQPTVTESTISTITHLPSKMKKLKDNQPDKNELMNELLTALDRVKVAIYKLQPLTAKMNAIYRKSVTSNTRDIIMDNHKGTYAKRYPPGDYDDTYDRMHPTELLSRRQTSSSKRRRAINDPMAASGSISRAIYLPAPKEMLLNRMGMLHNATVSNLTQVHQQQDGLTLSESKLVATGIGRRLGGGRIEGELKLSKLDSMYQDDDEEDYQVLSDGLNVTNKSASDQANVTLPGSAAPSFVPADELDDSGEGQSPLFGYRITIFQSPEEDNSGALIDSQISDKSGSQFSYQLDLGPDGSSNQPSVEDEVMVTSESSLSEIVRDRANSTSLADQDMMEESESKKLKKKSDRMKKEEEAKKSGAKEKGEKKKSKKSESKKKKEEEESKKKKEYKKIKHNKGIVSKEKKTMHRDKHIKAHDRGAAKEKALKERTQIEFFEREQIVDDEFEKGKKSTKKASWTTGHEGKKAHKESGGDTMQSAGSHYVEHGYPKDVYMEKGKEISAEATSAKQSNKFEKKNMEAKGKKFKGWREKGYKIITETEFIDRGSLHDSAYKKRDKGAAHHQKYKKQEASSEGHHGTMQEHHKKSRNKEEKKHKSQMKKHMKGGEDKKEHKQKESKKSSKKKLHEDHDHEESMLTATVEPIGSLTGNQQQESTMNRLQNSYKPVLVSASGNSFHTTPLPGGQPASLVKLLKVDHDEDQLTQPFKNHQPANLTMSRLFIPVSEHRRDSESLMRSNDNIPAKAVAIDTRSDDSDRTVLVDSGARNLGTNGTIFDIVENLTGRRLNKSMVGTYELDEQQVVGKLNLTTSNNITSTGPKFGNQQPVTRNESAIHLKSTDSPHLTTTSSIPSTKSNKQPSSQHDTLDTQLLVKLLQEANMRQQQLLQLKNTERFNQQLVASAKSSFLNQPLDQQDLALRGAIRDQLSDQQVPLAQFLNQHQQQTSGLFGDPNSIFQSALSQPGLQNNALNNEVLYSPGELVQSFSAYNPGNRFIDYDQNALLLAAAATNNFPMR